MGQGLTKREEEVVKWLREGKTSEAIGQIMGISPRTVEKHCEHIYEKLGVANRIGVFWHFVDRKGGGDGALALLGLAQMLGGLALGA
ncbi:MAG TPA: helix-turn-helix transcriptional regulator [Chthoniobacterales bacterium]|jgi:DNA-binding CsgD family transcriptional regulator